MKTASEIGNIYIIGNLKMRYIPVTGHNGSHIPLGRVVQHLIYAVFRLLVKLVMNGLYVPAVICKYTALCQCVQCQLG